MARYLRAFQHVQKFSFRPSAFCLSAVRPIHTGTANLAGLDKEFQAAGDRVKTLKQDPGNDHKLKLYALFKQVRSLVTRNEIYLHVIAFSCHTVYSEDAKSHTPLQNLQ